MEVRLSLSSLKKRMEHGSCFENLSITPGPGVYEPEQHYVYISWSRKENQERKQAIKERNTDILLKRPTLIVLSTCLARSISREDFPSATEKSSRRLKNLQDPSTISIKSKKRRGPRNKRTLSSGSALDRKTISTRKMISHLDLENLKPLIFGRAKHVKVGPLEQASARILR